MHNCYEPSRTLTNTQNQPISNIQHTFIPKETSPTNRYGAATPLTVIQQTDILTKYFLLSQIC
jgi:hypothetical protein